MTVGSFGTNNVQILGNDAFLMKFDGGRLQINLRSVLQLAAKKASP